MFEQFATFFTIEMIYLWINIGVLPFWLILIIFPQSKICGLLVTSILPFLYCRLYTLILVIISIFLDMILVTILHCILVYTT